jgi:hypothetical protein
MFDLQKIKLWVGHYAIEQNHAKKITKNAFEKTQQDTGKGRRKGS